MRDFLGFKFRVILNLYWIPFDAVVVFRPEHDFLFKSESTYCGQYRISLFLIDNERNLIQGITPFLDFTIVIFFVFFLNSYLYIFVYIQCDCHLMNFLFRYDNYKKFYKHVDFEMLFKWGEKSKFHKGSKNGLQKFFGPILRFYTKNSPRNS